MSNIDPTNTAADVLQKHVDAGNTSVEQMRRVLGISPKSMYRVLRGERQLSWEQGRVLAGRLQRVVADDLCATLPCRGARACTDAELDTNGDRRLDPTDAATHALRSVTEMTELLKRLQKSIAERSLWPNQEVAINEYVTAATRDLQNVSEIVRRITVRPAMAG